MNCCNCCENVLNLGCFDPCGPTIDLNDIVGIGDGGIWILEFEFGRSIRMIGSDLTVGNPISFTAEPLNELFEYRAAILKPDGSRYTKEIDGIVYDCFSFTVKNSYS